MSAGYSAYRDRTTLTLRLSLHSPLHVGSGHAIAVAGVEGDVSLLVRDAMDRPWIPPTTLKGALRSLIEATENQREQGAPPVASMFGSIKTSSPEKDKDRGNTGWIVFSGAHVVTTPDLSQRVDRWPGKETSGTILSKRTAIDDASGTADPNKLFQFQMVPPGTTFEARITILRGPPSDAATLFDDPAVLVLTQALASWRSKGIAIGRGKGDGAGLLKLVGITRAERIRVRGGAVARTLDEKPGEWNARTTPSNSVKPLDRAKKRYQLVLASDQPFAVVGPGLVAKSDTREKGSANTLRALRRDEKTPELPGSSLMGALRAKAEWFDRLEALRAGRGKDEKRIERLFGADADAVKEARERGDKRTGFAGILRLRSVVVAEERQARKIDSVKVDRFSMGPFDTGLFAVEAFPKPSFRVELYLDERADDGDVAFADRFIAWLEKADPSAALALGHGGNRGFGWFSVTREGAK